MKLGLESWVRRGDGEADPAETLTQLKPGGFEAPSVEELAPRFPQLEIRELLGKGGMGAVYKARQRSLDRLVALKIINPHVAEDPGFAERFSREARSLARLNHPNIVTAHDFGESDGLYYFIMEYVDGANVRQLLRAGTLTPQGALRIVPPLCDALQYAHDEGIVHRDIKPENLLIDTKGRVKIADFGLAKLVGRSPQDVTLTAAHQAMGTPHYMAPEQMLSPLEVDHRSDIYSLGVTLYEMLTGELPLGRFAPPSQKVQVDVRLDEVVLKTLEREPGRRYQHASDVKTAVEAAISSAFDPLASGRSSLAGGRAPARQILIGLACLLVALNLAALAVVLELDPAGGIHPRHYAIMIASISCSIGLYVIAGSVLGARYGISPASRTRVDHAGLEPGSADPGELERTIVAQLLKDKIKAIRVYREMTGTDLAAAKAAVEAIANDHGITSRKRTPRQRAWDVAVFSIALLLALWLAEAAPIGDVTRGGIILGSALAYLVLLIATWIGIRRHRRESAGRPSDESSSRSTWSAWWESRPQWIRMAVYVLLAIIYAAGLLLFFSCSGSRRPDGHVFEIGHPTPWLVVRQAGTDFEWSLHLGTSVLAAVAGLTALELGRTLGRIEGRRVDPIHVHVGIWGFLLALVAGLGLTSFVLHARSLPLDRPDTAAAEHGAVVSAAVILGALMLLGVIAVIGSIVALIRRKPVGDRPGKPVRGPALGLRP